MSFHRLRGCRHEKKWIALAVVAAALTLAQGGMPRAGLTSEVQMLNGVPTPYVNGTVEALRRTWNDPQVVFDTARPPNEVERYAGNHGIFFDPGVSGRVPDNVTDLPVMLAANQSVLLKLENT
jgi:hypothetical protein